MRSHKSLLWIAILATCLVFTGTAFGNGAIEIPNKALISGTAVFSGPAGFYATQDFKAGEKVFLSLFDNKGQFLPDGLYKWEIRYNGTASGDRDGFHVGTEVESGVFTIKNGALVNPNMLEVSTKDQQILDDLIVDGSICVGQDCNNGESFGFDTLRMKENNLRIKAQDTSNSASFPTNDWQLTFNESSNGGQNKFSVDDIDGGRTPFTIEASAPSHSLYVDDGGRIGIGTSTPTVDIHVKSGNTPTLRLEQDGTSGFTAQTWDLAGNEANLFLRDATTGSTLPFRLFPGAPSNALTIEGTTGHIGLGTTTPEDALQIVENGAANVWVKAHSPGIFLEDSDNADDAVQFSQNGALDLFRIRAVNSAFAETAAGISLGTTTGVVGINCTDAAEAAVGARLVVGDGDSCFGTFSAIVPGVGVIDTSSRTLKENLQQVREGDILEKIAGIDVYTYDFIDGPKDVLGLMAEDFHQVFGRGSDKMIQDRDVQMALWLAVQKLTGEVDRLKAELAAEKASTD